MCGIVGIVGFTPVNQQIYDALTVLQHRGQDAAGIMTEHEGALYLRKDVGLVRDVFQQRHMLQLKGNIGIGHVRYPTAGCDSSDEAQPFYVNAPYGICLAHNGNLTNARQLAGRADARGPPSPQHLVRLRGAAQRARERAAAVRYDARLGCRHLRRDQRHVPPDPGRLRRRRDDPRPRRDRLPRSARHPSAGHRQARYAARPRAHDRVGKRRARPERLRADARRRVRARPSTSTRPAACTRSSVREPRASHAVHLRVRVLCAARFDHRQHLGLQGAPAHGRAAGRQDPAHAPGTTTSTS